MDDIELKPYDTTEADGLLAWFKMANFDHFNPPNKWVLQMEQEMRRMREALSQRATPNPIPTGDTP